MSESVAGAIILSIRNHNQEWRFQAGTLADMLETGSPLSAKAQAALRKLIPSAASAETREQWVSALRQEENQIIH